LLPIQWFLEDSDDLWSPEDHERHGSCYPCAAPVFFDSLDVKTPQGRLLFRIIAFFLSGGLLVYEGGILAELPLRAW
jgi:hypothetical protein